MALCKQVYKQAAGKREERQRDSEMVKENKRERERRAFP
jgi:hypothetical protein